MALNPLNSSNLDQLALKGLMWILSLREVKTTRTDSKICHQMMVELQMSRDVHWICVSPERTVGRPSQFGRFCPHKLVSAENMTQTNDIG